MDAQNKQHEDTQESIVIHLHAHVCSGSVLHVGAAG